MPKLDVYNISQLGVNVDKGQVFLDDGELTKAQNAQPSRIDSGLRKRQGLVEFNSAQAAGSVIGGVGVPLSYQGTLGTAIQKIYVGRWNGAGTSLGWTTTTDDFTTLATISSGTPSNPANPNNFSSGGKNFARSWWSRPSVVFRNRIYYASDDFTVGTTDPTIRVFDGTFDEPLNRIPPVGTTPSRAVLCMAALNNSMYLTTFDDGSAGTASLTGRVFNLTEDGTLYQLGASFPTGVVPFSLTWAFGRLWCGTNAGSFAGHGTSVYIYWFRPGIDTTWTLDRTVTASDVAVMAMTSYRGQLYAGYVNSTNNAALVETRTALGVWSTADTGAAGAPADPYHGYTALGTFGANLYALRYGEAGEGLKIRKFDGTTWSTVKTIAIVSGGAAPYVNFFQHNTNFYALGGTSSNTPNFLVTTDGTTWNLVNAVSNSTTSHLGILVS